MGGNRAVRLQPETGAPEAKIKQRGNFRSGRISMGRAIRWLYGFLIGGLTGAGLALLFTPQSGAELRQRIRARWRQIVEEGREAAAQRRAELERELAALIRPSPPGTSG